ncbi:MAG: primosomal protein N' [Candidatus Hydrogenedentes bacterium CG1_02_42_14]|nr:MAG: primosomal protein N' [Candidatus Hydrogenedentes bacterium CG1_02_42_14]
MNSSVNFGSKFVSVLVPVPVGKDETFTYLAPEDVKIGERVRVGFGKREVIGYIVGESSAREGAKSITYRIDSEPVITRDVIELTKYMANELFVPWYRCMEAAVPSGLKLAVKGAKPRFKRVLSIKGSIESAEIKTAGEERALSCIKIIAGHPETFGITDIMRKLEVSRNFVEKLIKKDVLVISEQQIQRNPFSKLDLIKKDVMPDLTQEQKRAVEEIRDADGKIVLVWGVTGSGKTEIYLRAISEVIEKGKGAIVLVPEISLTPQTVDRFRARLGDKIAVLHSSLSSGERLDEWMRLRDGRARVAVGPRSALFAPIDNLGIIVIDEAHEATYKQNETPRYNAIKIAEKRAKFLNIPLVLGTATPTCEQYYKNISAGEPIIELPSRVTACALPNTKIVDMRQELAEGHTSIFSRMLIREIKKALQNREQIILFLNRRGHASFVLCRACGESIKCPRCAVSLTVHLSERRNQKRVPELICHICNHRVAHPSKCPSCGSHLIKAFGAGTEKIEEEVYRIFPSARAIRMDADTTAKKDSHRKILETFIAGEKDILIGTQMIGKGLDLSRVTLVGIIAADSSLHLPDFRAEERTFQQIVQVVGRAGRAEKKGLAIIQTYVPSHPAVAFAAEQNVKKFIEYELKRRKASNMPPFTRLLQWTFESEIEEAAVNGARELSKELQTFPGEILGPAPAPLEKLRGRFRWQVRLVIESNTNIELFSKKLNSISCSKRKDLRVLLDIDPLDLM